MIGYRAGRATGRDRQRPARASPGAALAKARHAFWVWRRTRPFWGGLLVIVGAGEMLASEQAPIPFVSQIGIRGLGSYLTPIFMLLCGVLLWFTAAARTYHALLAILLALYSWLTANLGGFLVGMLIGVIGGALAFAWTTDADHASPGQPAAPAKIRVPPRAIELMSGLKAHHARRSQRPRRRARPATAPVQEALFELSEERESHGHAQILGRQRDALAVPLSQIRAIRTRKAAKLSGSRRRDVHWRAARGSVPPADSDR